MMGAIDAKTLISRVARTLYEAPEPETRIHEEEWDDVGESIKDAMRHDARLACLTVLIALSAQTDDSVVERLLDEMDGNSHV